MKWTITKSQSALDEIREYYPYFVDRITINLIEDKVYNWILENKVDCVVVQRHRTGPYKDTGSWVITYGFRDESDATMFKLKFT